MMKHSIALLVAFATTALAGCQLYFGEEENNGTWNYCGSDGYYECTDNDCYWRGPECPAGWDPSGPNGTPPGGFECKEDDDCAAGCYCSDAGLCEEAGFCANDDDCGAGYTCDEGRASCVPEEETPATPCLWDSECAVGEYCSPDTLECTASCTCATDADATAQGFGFCDETRGTCLPGSDPVGTCAGSVAPTCNVARPTCAQGSVATLLNGCFTGQCQVITTCDQTPECSSYRHDMDCRADNTCSASYTGTGCKKPDNTPCQAGDTNCTCATYTFAACNEGGTPRVEFNGFSFNVSELTLRN